MGLLLAVPSEAAIIDLTPEIYRATAATTTVGTVGQVEKVEENYRLKGHLLALVPVSLSVKAEVHPDGTVEFDYPWFAFLTLSRRAELETELKVAIANARKARLRASVVSSGEPANPSFSEEEAELIEKEMERIFKDE